RDQVRQHEDALYAARIRLSNAEQQRSRAQRRQTVPSADRDAEISRLRADMAQLSIKMNQLRERDQAISQQLARIANLRRMITQLTQRRELLRSRADRLRQQLAALQQQQTRTDEITRLSTELQATAQSQTQLSEAIQVAGAELAGLHQGEQQLQ